MLLCAMRYCHVKTIYFCKDLWTLNSCDLWVVDKSEGGTRQVASSSVQDMSLAFHREVDVRGGDSLPLGMLGVGDGFADDFLKEYLQNTRVFS